MLYKHVRRRQYVLRRAVILFELINFATRKIVGKIEDVFEIRTAPTVYALVFVSHRKHVAVFRAHEPYQIVLNCVGVLEFVHVNIFEPVLAVFERVGIFTQKSISYKQKVVVVESVVCSQFLLIFGVYNAYLVYTVVIVVKFFVFVGRESRVFGVG